MKKELKEQYSKFRNLEMEIFLELYKDNKNPEERAKLEQVKAEVISWLEGLAGGFETDSKVKRMISLAGRELEYAAKENADLIAYVRECTRKGDTSWPKYYAISENMGQIAALADQAALDKVRKIANYPKKQNRKNFLNVVACRFKKSKVQQSKETEQGSKEQANG